MGKGKGAVEYWLQLLNLVKLCLKLEVFYQLQKKRYVCSSKLPVKTKFIVARDFEA